MPKFYTSVILLINQSKEICEKQFSVFGSKGGQINPLMHIPLFLPIGFNQFIILAKWITLNLQKFKELLR